MPITPEEAGIMEQQLGYGYPEPEEKQNIFNFFKRVVSQSDNTKTANLEDEEIGQVNIPMRTNLDLANYCEFMGMPGFAEVFKKDAQVVAAPSLSRQGALIQLAVTQKREAETRIRKQAPKENKGWFKPKNQPQTFEDVY